VACGMWHEGENKEYGGRSSGGASRWAIEDDLAKDSPRSGEAGRRGGGITLTALRRQRCIIPPRTCIPFMGYFGYLAWVK